MNKMLTILTGAALLLLFILYSTTYTVAYHELAVVTRFGQVHEVRTEPGLSLKLPFFADRVHRFDTRLQMVESPLRTIQTADDEQLVVQTFFMWKVDAEDPKASERFFRGFSSIDVARSEIASDLEDAMTVLSRYTFNELFGEQNRIEEAEKAMLEELQRRRGGDGVSGQFVGVSQVLFPPTTTRAVLTRMQATRQSMAQNERFKGQAEATAIESDLRTKLGKIRAFAEQRATEIRADASTRSAEYIREMDQESELAIFLAGIDALEQSLSQNTTFVLDADALAPFHLMNLAARIDDRGIPVPRSRLAGGDLEVPVDSDLESMVASVLNDYLRANDLELNPAAVNPTDDGDVDSPDGESDDE